MEDNSEANVGQAELLQMTSEIVSSYVSFNSISMQELPSLIKSINQTLVDLRSADTTTAEEPQKPAVSIRRSIQDEYLICLEDGKKLKMLKRYLRTRYNLTPDEYRKKWGLPADYPMVAPNYSKQRSNFAKNIGLGRRGD